jgi:beta-RFAP synthase
MIHSPSVVVTVQPAVSWRFEGRFASRAQAFAIRFAETLPESERRPFQVLVEQSPDEHIGLGVGTQLGMAVARALAMATGHGDWPATELAPRVGRGERSAIGIHGFDRGGLLVESGKHTEEVSPLLARVALPEEWRVVLFRPPAPTWHGDRERAAFAAARGGEPEALRRIAREMILPAARAADLEALGEAIHEFNRRAGEPFVAAQHGPYASPAIGELIAELRSQGIGGVGQSSWGPTVFALVSDAGAALELVLRYRNRLPVTVARVSTGHHLEDAPS